MRHNRAAAFRAQLSRSATPTTGRRWTDVSDDPNDVAALSHRAATLRAAWRPPIPDRIAYLVERARGRRVLDIGCVAHDTARMASPGWLHGRLAAVSSCVGVDVLEAGIEAMRERGFEVLLHDLRTGFGPVLDLRPFDVIVAGEVFEHIEDAGLLFRLADAALGPTGELIITTPNPYTRGRVHAARRGIVSENTDHLFYAFPSGVAELAERHGLVLQEACTIPRAQARWSPRSVLRWLRASRWVNVGFATVGRQRARRVDPRLRAPRRWARHTRFDGETFVYVVVRARGAGS